MTVLLFLAVLFVLVLVHELGHFSVAKWFGIRVDEFGIGFPPKAGGIRFGDTEYTLNWLPIGGFVKIWGEDPTEEQRADDPDAARSFARKPRYVQAAVLVAGVTMNVLLAYALYATSFMLGMPVQLDPSDPRVQDPETQLLVTGIVAGSPAASMLKTSDEIRAVRSGAVTLSGTAVRSPSAVADLIASSGGQEVTFTLKRRGEFIDAVVRPLTGVIPETPERAAAGFEMSLVGMERLPLFAAMGAATKRTYTTLRDITVGIGTLFADALRGKADLAQVSGPVGIVGLVGDAAALGTTWLLTFAALISLNLAVINLIPIPALDGGRLLFVMIEALIRRPLNPRIATRVNQVGFILLLALMALITVHDVLKLF